MVATVKHQQVLYLWCALYFVLYLMYRANIVRVSQLFREMGNKSGWIGAEGCRKRMHVGDDGGDESDEEDSTQTHRHTDTHTHTHTHTYTHTHTHTYTHTHTHARGINSGH